MKKSIALGISLMAALAFAGCSKIDMPEDGSTQNQNNEIRFDIGFAPFFPSQNMGEASTRVLTMENFKSTFEEGDEIGVFAVKRTLGEENAPLHSSGNYIHNVRLTYSATNGGTWITDPGVEMKYPSQGEALDFYAYYPYDDAGGDPTTLDPTAFSFSVETDQNALTGGGQSTFNTSHFLTARIRGVVRSEDPVELTFHHKLSLVEVQVTRNEANIPVLDATLRVQLMGINPLADVDLGSTEDELSLSSLGVKSAISMHRLEQPGDANYATQFTYRALVPTQTIYTADLNAKKLINFTQTTSGKSFSLDYMTYGDVVLAVGDVKRFAINLDRTL